MKKFSVSAAVMGVFKRVVTIGAAVLWYGTHVTALHALGIGVAVVGVFSYQEKERRTPEAATPHVASLGSLALALSPRRGSSAGGGRQQALLAMQQQMSPLRPAASCRGAV